MAAPRKLPPAPELKRLAEELGSVSAAARHLGIPRTSVYGALRRYNNTTQAPGMNFAPWIVTLSHSKSETALNLRIDYRARASSLVESVDGNEIGDTVPASVVAWRERLECNDFVISYHRDTPGHDLEPQGGFYYRPRSAGDSPGIMQAHPDSEPAPSTQQLAEWASGFV